MQNAIAFADDDDIVVVTRSYGHKLADCMGFAVYWIDETGKETALPSTAFPGFKRKPGQTVAEFSAQKFYWKDPTPGSLPSRPAPSGSGRCRTEDQT